jgi:hypothetical protein
MRWVEGCNTKWEIGNAYTVWMKNLKGKYHWVYKEKVKLLI